MKTKLTKYLSLLICICLAFTFAVSTRTNIKGAEESVFLFHNDRAWALSSSLPAVKRYSIYYVPISFLVQLPTVDVRMNASLKTFIITHGDYYLSFDMTSDFTMNQDKESMYLKTAEYHGERYVPVETVCICLNLGYEMIVSESTGAVGIRVTDGYQNQMFKTLLTKKYPELFNNSPPVTETVTDTETETNPPETDPPETEYVPVLENRTIYLSIENGPGKYTEKILDVLNKYGYKATFFVTSDKITKNITALSKIAAQGHTIALHSSGNKGENSMSYEALLRDIEEQNKLLSKIIKKKSHIKFVSQGTKINSDTKEQLLEAGYVLWQPNITVPSNVRTTRSSANSLINGIWKYKTAAISIEENEKTADILEILLRFISNNKKVCEVRTVKATFVK